MRLRHGLALAFAALAAAGCGSAEPVTSIAPTPTPTVTPAPPEPDGELPRDAAGLAAALRDVGPRLRAAARAWDGRGRTPRDLELLALYVQRAELRLADRPALARRVLPRLSRRLAADLRDGIRAERDLARLSRGWPLKRRHRTGRPQPAARLLRHYRAAHRRFRVSVTLLAAVNLIESQFGRLRNESVSGAQGPMQFMPATWDAYGMGGDVHDPRDAILGAANYLRASGAPRDEPRALFHYNPSRLYVRAVLRQARRMRRDFAAFHELYARQVFVRAPGGRRRITGP